MVEYEEAVAIWLSERTGDDPDKIKDIEFDIIHGGYCETCEYTTFGITYRVKGNYKDYEGLRSIAPADFIREVSEIIQREGIND